MSMVGTGMVMKSFPFLPIISPFWTYFLRLRLIRPRTMSRNRPWSCLIFSAIVPSLRSVRALPPAPLVLRVAAREDRRDEVEDVRGADLAVPVVLHEPLLHHVDLLLRVAVDDRRDEVLQLDRVLLVLEQLQLERLVEPLVRPVVEGLPLDRERADVVHDLAAEVVLPAVSDVDLLLDRPHEPLVRLLVLARVLVPDLLALRVRLDVVDVVRAELRDRVLVRRDRALDLVLHRVLVLALHVGEEIPEPLPLLLGADERVLPQPVLELVQHHERVHAALALVRDERVRDLVLDVAGADALHALAERLLAELLDVVLGEVRQRLPVVELQLLDEREVVLLRLLEPGEHAPHRGHLERVRRDVLAADLVAVVVALVDLHLLVEAGDVRDVELDRAVAQRLHELVRLELLVLGLVGVPDDDLVDVGLRELLRLDLVLL